MCLINLDLFYTNMPLQKSKIKTEKKKKETNIIIIIIIES